MTAVNNGYTKHMYVTGVALDRDGIAQSQNVVANTAMTLNGDLASGGSYTAGDGGSSCKVGHLIGIYSSANITNDVFTIVGTDPDGLALTETVTGVNANTVFTTKYFYTVTSVKDDTTQAVNTIEVGIGNTFATQRVPIIYGTNTGNVGYGLTASGTYSITLQHTMDDIHDTSVTPSYIADTSFATKSATFWYGISLPVTASRFIAVSYSSTPAFSFHVLQNKPY